MQQEGDSVIYTDVDIGKKECEVFQHLRQRRMFFDLNIVVSEHGVFAKVQMMDLSYSCHLSRLMKMADRKTLRLIA